MTRTSKKKLATAPEVDDPKVLRITDDCKTPHKEQMARHALSPQISGAMLVQVYAPEVFKDCTDITEIVKELKAQQDAVIGGSMDRAEAMLITQAHNLDMIFGKLAVRAAINMGKYPDAAETYMKLALRAQSQCRATLESLATIKNPPNVAFVKQANIANGPQQVNNGTVAAVARVEENTNPQTELSRLTDEKGQRVDFGAQGEAGGSDPAMATVEAVNRPKDGSR